MIGKLEDRVRGVIADMESNREHHLRCFTQNKDKNGDRAEGNFHAGKAEAYGVAARELRAILGE